MAAPSFLLRSLYVSAKREQSKNIFPLSPTGIAKACILVSGYDYINQLVITGGTSVLQQAKLSPVDECVELLCQRGCRAVTGYITELEAGKDLPETTRLSIREREQVLAELVSIMAVYEGPCPAG